MRQIIRRGTTLAVLGALAVGSSLPAVAQSGQTEQITHRQSILTELSPTGETGTSRVFTQLTATGSGEVTVALPKQSTDGLRSLDGFGGPDVDGDTVIHTLDASSEDGRRARTVADNVAPLPVSMSVVYRLDGTEVDPGELAGRDGRVEVEYTVRNLTAEPRDIVAFDAENNRVIEEMDVAVPMVGSLSLTLPPSFTGIDAPGAVTAGDGRGNTVLNYSLLLFAPLGSEEVTVTWSADSADTAIPETAVQILPVDSDSFGSLSATAEAYKGATDSLTELANGALIINSNLQLLASGAGELLDGLNQLADGASQLDDGLTNTAAPGARQLADGMGQARAGGGELATGLGELALGATRLSDGLGDARAGGTALRAGLGDLAAGMTQVSGFLGDASSGADELSEGLVERAAPGAVRIRDGLSGLLAAVGGEDDDADDETLIGGMNSLLTGLTGDLATGTGALALLSTGLAGSFGPDEAAGGANAGQKAQAAADGAAAIAAGAGRLAQGVGALKLQNGAIPFLSADEHLDYGDIEDDFLCLDSSGPTVAPGEVPTFPPGIAIPESCWNDDVINAVAFGIAGGDETTPPETIPTLIAAGMPTLNAVLAAVGADINDDGLVRLSAHLDTLIAGLSAPVLPGDQKSIVTGANELSAGLQAQADSLGTDWPSCEEAVAAAQRAAAGGDDPTGLEVIRALQCISAQVNTGLTTEVIPGVRQLRVGLSNPDAFDRRDPGFNPDCDPATPRNRLQPCGVKQALQLLGGGSVELASGLGDAAEGSEALADGLRELAAGARQLDDGTGTAAAGAGELLAGLVQLDDGGEQLAAGAGAAASGSRDLSAGLVQLEDGAMQLANGLVDAADGSGQIADGLGQAAEGGEQIAGGGEQLADAVGTQLVGGVSAGRLGASQDLEQVKAVIARGREGAAPYGIAEGAQASTVFQFDVAGVGTEDGPSTALLVVLALVALGAAGALGLALQRRLGA